MRIFLRFITTFGLGCPKDKIGAVKSQFDLDDDGNWLLILDSADELESYQLTY